MGKLTDATPAETRTLVHFGVGTFNLMVSLMPSEYLQVSKLAGFSGNRHLALQLLQEGCTSRSYWAPFSGLMTLFYHTQLAPLLGLVSADTASEAARGVSEEMTHLYPQDCALFGWLHAGVHRLHRRNSEAAALAAVAAANSAELPPLRGLATLDRIFSALLELQWPSALEGLEEAATADCATPAAMILTLAYLRGLAKGAVGDSPGAIAALSELLAAEESGAAEDHRLPVLVSRRLVASGGVSRLDC